MMRVNIGGESFNLSEHFDNQINRRVKDVIKEWKRDAPPIILNNIRKHVSIGNSPVEGYGRYKGYSKSYKEQINGKASYRTITKNGIQKVIRITPQLASDKKKFINKKERPVNLYLSGKMMNSMRSYALPNGFYISFSTVYARELANLHSHNSFEKAKVKRKLIPNEYERFKKAITLESDEMIFKRLQKRFKEIF